MRNNIISLNGKTPEIDDAAFIATTAVIIGDVRIGAGSGIWYHCVVRGDLNEIRIGENTNIQDGSVIHVDSVTFGTYIGDNVTVGHMCLIHACRLETGCLVGMHSTVMDGAVVEAGGLLAARSLLPPGKRVGAGQLWAGSPAKFMCPVNESHQELIDRIWPGYRKLMGQYKAEGLDSRQQSGTKK